MNCVESMNMTIAARHGFKAIGLSIDDVLGVVQSLRRCDFYKSMTTYSDHRVWQDV